MQSSQPATRQLHYEQKSANYFSDDARINRIVRMVGGPGKRVLDVGCGPGHIGSVIRARGNYVAGCEFSEQAAAKARTVLDEVFVYDIEEAWPRAVQEKPFDAIVLGEVLEHVFDPVEVLLEARKALVDDGRVVITTPNFMVWIARLQMLFGRFRYTEYGIFDFGHIRWFTYRYMQQVVRDAGFELEEEEHMMHPRFIEPATKRWPSLFALHFVVSARKVATVPPRTKLE